MLLPRGLEACRESQQWLPERSAGAAQHSSVELMLQVRVGGPVLLDNLGRRLVRLSEPHPALHLLEQRRAKAQREPCDDRFHEELHDCDRSITRAGCLLFGRALGYDPANRVALVFFSVSSILMVSSGWAGAPLGSVESLPTLKSRREKFVSPLIRMLSGFWSTTSNVTGYFLVMSRNLTVASAV